MTFTEDKTVIDVSERGVSNIGHALRELLIRTNKADRLVVGVMESVQILQSNPDEVSLCILTITDDVTAQIHHKFVEAFCWENDIEVVKVKGNKKIETTLVRNENIKNVEDAVCMVILRSETDDLTNDFMENYYSIIDGVLCSIIELPE